MNQELATIIQKGFTPPFVYDAYGAAIFDSNNKHIIDIRGYGHLQYLGEGVADEVQSAIGREVTNHLNMVTGHVPAGVVGYIGRRRDLEDMFTLSAPQELDVVITPRPHLDTIEPPLPFADYSDAGLIILYQKIQEKTCKLSRAERNAVVKEYNRRRLS